MATLRLRVRYFQDCTPEGVPCREENFIRREIDMDLPVAQTALVLVDMWDAHFIESWLERAAQMTREAGGAGIGESPCNWDDRGARAQPGCCRTVCHQLVCAHSGLRDASHGRPELQHDFASGCDDGSGISRHGGDVLCHRDCHPRI